MGRFACASDRGQWSIYCERASEIAVIGIHSSAQVERYAPLLSQLAAAPIAEAVGKPISYGFSSGAISSQWRDDLLKEYGPSNVMRTLTAAERHAIEALAAEIRSDDERNQLLSDLRNCAVRDVTPDGSLFAFEIPGYERPPDHTQGGYRGKDGFPVEGVVKDADGAEMSVYLYGDAHDRIYEFELDRHADGSVIGPDWSTFRVR